jgi:hypothetical protein
MTDTPSECDQTECCSLSNPVASDGADSKAIIKNIRGLILGSKMLVQSMKPDTVASANQLPVLCDDGMVKIYQKHIADFLKAYTSFESVASLSLRERFLEILGYTSDECTVPYKILLECTTTLLLESDRELDIYFNRQQSGDRWRENGHLGAIYKSVRNAPWPTKQDILEVKVMTTDSLKVCCQEIDTPEQQASHTEALNQGMDLALQTLVLLDCLRVQKGLAQRLDVSLIYLRERGNMHRLPKRTDVNQDS